MNSSSSSLNPRNLPSSRPVYVRTITRHNYLVEFSAINYLINATPFTFVSIDTDFPGHIIPTSRTDPKHPTAVYSRMKANVNALKLIQVGIVITDAQGNLPNFSLGFGFVWEVLISDFDLRVDLHDPQSINLLMQQGVKFHENLNNGISPNQLVERLEWCGIIRRENSTVTWVCYNGAYDFGYMIKLLTHTNLPESLLDFLGLVGQYFGNNVYDIRHVSNRLGQINVWGGIDKLAKRLGVDHVVLLVNRTACNALMAIRIFHKIRSGRNELAVRQFSGQIHNLCN